MDTAKVTRISPMPQPDPLGRLDVLLLEIAKRGTQWGERKIRNLTGLDVNLWDGPGGLGAVVEGVLDECGVPREQLTPRVVVEGLGLVKPKRMRRAG